MAGAAGPDDHEFDDDDVEDAVERVAPPPARRDHARAVPTWRKRAWGLATRTLGLAVAAGLLGAWVIADLAQDLPSLDSARSPRPAGSTLVYDRHGELAGQRGPAPGAPVSLASLPPHVVAAVVAAEDRRFYTHSGVDLQGMARAAWVNVRAGAVRQGGSTLTQQLAKNMFLSPERTLRRKGREAILAIRLEQAFSKDEILEMYLNRVYFGAGAYGIDAAARRYYGKPAAMLSLPESAVLAGLLRAPSVTNPLADTRRAEDNATRVLEAMAAQNRISRYELEQALAEAVRVRGSADAGEAAHFVDWAAAEARAMAGDDGMDLIVRTTLDLSFQREANRAVAQMVSTEGAEKDFSEAALISLDGDGAVRAMVGGASYARSAFNRATMARRQPGSAFKAFAYAAAFEHGASPWDVALDAPVDMNGWSPRNYGDRFNGEVELWYAFAKSLNSVAVRVIDEVGAGEVAKLARRMGVSSPLQAVPSLALGASEITLLDLVTGYAPFANAGYRVEPYAVTALERPDGAIVWARSTPDTYARVIEPRVLEAMNLLLARVVTEGTGRAAALPDRAVAGKTGTTNDFRDAWFVGYVPGLITAVWVGNDDHGLTMDKVTGGTAPARMWNAYMRAVTQDQPPAPLDLPPGFDAVAPEPEPAPAAAAQTRYTPAAASLDRPHVWAGD